MVIKTAAEIPRRKSRPKRSTSTGGSSSAAALARPGPPLAVAPGSPAGRDAEAQTPLADVKKSPFSTDEKPNAFEDITGYNNFYEFGTRQGRSGALRRQAEGRGPGRSRSRARSPSPATTPSTTC